jgi:hypothetical protein
MWPISSDFPAGPVLFWSLGVETDLSIETYLSSVGRVERTFGEREDSRTSICTVRWGADVVVVKYAEDREAIGWLENAEKFRRAVRHPLIPTVLGTIRTACRVRDRRGVRARLGAGRSFRSCGSAPGTSGLRLLAVLGSACSRAGRRRRSANRPFT